MKLGEAIAVCQEGKFIFRESKPRIKYYKKEGFDTYYFVKSMNPKDLEATDWVVNLSSEIMSKDASA